MATGTRRRPSTKAGTGRRRRLLLALLALTLAGGAAIGALIRYEALIPPLLVKPLPKAERVVVDKSVRACR